MWKKFKYTFLGALGYQWLFLVGFTHAFTLDLDSRYLRMTDPELGRVQDFLKEVSENMQD